MCCNFIAASIQFVRFYSLLINYTIKDSGLLKFKNCRFGFLINTDLIKFPTVYNFFLDKKNLAVPGTLKCG